MATTRRATAEWNGSLLEGGGAVTLASSGIGTFPMHPGIAAANSTLSPGHPIGSC